MARITTPFGFTSTARDIVRGVDLSGKRAIVTGATSGIGIETARALAEAGAEVTLAVRRVDAGEAVAAQIRSEAPNAKLAVRPLELSDQASVRSFVKDWSGKLHILVNNAGIMALPTLEHTAQGWEQQFNTNFMGHFTLTLGLHKALAAAQGARIVSVSSSAHMYSPILFEDLHFNFVPYVPIVAYAQSKTANALLAVEATRRWASDGIIANTLNPGAIPTNLQKHTGAMKTPPEKRKNVQQGAATSVLLAASPLVNGIGGRYFEDCNEAKPITKRPMDFSGGVAPFALDAASAERLWDVALKLTS
jgi:NAD(P)-dependent dehydrogenase (short-subunit alcohol dehydrogenase family)